MEQFTYENQGMESMLVYQLGKEEHLDSFAKGMLQANEMEGILCPSFTQRDFDKFLKYPVTGKVPLNCLQQEEMEKETVLRLFLSISGAVKEMEDYMLSQEKLLLDPEYIFVDVRKKEASLIYLPVDEFVQEISVAEFLLHLLSHMQYQLSEDVSYVAKLICFLNRPKGWQFEELKRYLQELLIEKTEKKEKKDPIPDFEVREAQARVMQGAALANGMAQAGMGMQPEPAVQMMPQPPVNQGEWKRGTPQPSAMQGEWKQSQPEAGNAALRPLEKEKTDKKRKGLFHKEKKAKKKKETAIQLPGMEVPGGSGLSPMDIPGHESAVSPASGMGQPEVILNVDEDGSYLLEQPSAKEKKKGGLFRWGKKKEAADSSRQPGPDIPMPMPETGGFVQPASRPEYRGTDFSQAAPRPEYRGTDFSQIREGSTVYMGHGSSDDENHTVIMGGGGEYGSTVHIGLDGGQKETAPRHVVRITRRRTGQSMVINKFPFRIGSEGSYVDFYIGDNRAISASHADIFEEDGVFFIVDRNSSNHTYVNRAMVQPMKSTQLSNGCIVTLADEDFDFIVS